MSVDAQTFAFTHVPLPDMITLKSIAVASVHGWQLIMIVSAC